MPSKRSKSKERKRKKTERAKHSVEQKRKVNQKQAEYQREKLKSETNEERNIRIAKVSEYMNKNGKCGKMLLQNKEDADPDLKSGLLRVDQW